MMNDRTNRLTDFERKLLTIIYHHNKRGHLTTIEELELRTGHEPSDIEHTINDLIAKKFLSIEGKELIVRFKLF